MTEKRFVEKYVGRTNKKLIGIEDIETGRICVTIGDNIQLLNELNDLNQELYQFRLVYNALIFNEWHKKTLIKLCNHDDTNLIEVYKSKKHYDGSIPFSDDEDAWFIVVAILPNGKQISNHYPLKYWDYFKIPEYDKVKDEFDGHTSKDVLERLKEVI